MYLGLDLGTSGVKALLIDDEQRIKASGNGSLEVTRPHSGWSEQDPEHWIRATEHAVQELRASHGKELAAVKGIGLSGQMHGATLLDANDQVLRPCVLWNDTRSHKEASTLDADPKIQGAHGQYCFPRLYGAKSGLG